MRVLVIVATFLLATAILAGFLGGVHPAFDSFAHFRAHLSLLAALAGLLLVLLRQQREGLSVLVLAILAGTTAAPAWISAGKAHGAANGLRIVHANLRFDNPQRDAALALLQQEDPDVLLLAEVSPQWANRLAAVKEWPHRLICPGRGKIGGTAILSNLPFLSNRTPECHDSGGLAIATIDAGSGLITLAEWHLHWPWPSRQMEEIDDLAQILSTLPPTTLLAGDFNAAPWSAALGKVSTAGKLSIVNGVGGTWSPMSMATFRHFGLPLDNVLEGSNLVASAHAIDLPGSDHRAVTILAASRNR
jgi:endonuclease/exonuclease/phosphatase (EEP) superfamily protein YafD